MKLLIVEFLNPKLEKPIEDNEGNPVFLLHPGKTFSTQEFRGD